MPNLGVVSLGTGESFVVADIPGLIEGAADGAGLGHQFLKHVERCGLYLHLLSLDEHEAQSPLERFTALNKELAKYDDNVAKRPQLVVLTKTDVREPDEVEAMCAELQAHLGTSVYTIQLRARRWPAGAGRRGVEAAAEDPRLRLERRTVRLIRTEPKHRVHRQGTSTKACPRHVEER